MKGIIITDEQAKERLGVDLVRDFNSLVYGERKAPEMPPKYDHAMGFAWLLKASRRAVDDEKAKAGLWSFMSFAQAQAALGVPERFRVPRADPRRRRWRWGINYAKASSLMTAGAIFGSVATRRS